MAAIAATPATIHFRWLRVQGMATHKTQAVEKNGVRCSASTLTKPALNIVNPATAMSATAAQRSTFASR